MDQQSNPGSATPETLHRIYRDRAAVAANPFVLRDVQASHGITLSSTVGGVFASVGAADDAAEREALLQSRAILAPAVGCNGSTRRPKPTGGGGAAPVPQQRRVGERRGDSPPRARFKVISEGQRMPGAGSHPHHHHHHQAAAQTGMTLTLNSLDMSRKV